MSEKHVIQLNPGLSTEGPYLSGAISPVYHLGIMANAFTNWESLERMNYREIACGYYTGFQHQVNLELYGGYGHGNSSMNDTINHFIGRKTYYQGRGHYDLYFTQANIGINLDSMLYISAGFRYIFLFDYKSASMRRDNEYFTRPEIFGRGFEFTYQMKAGYKYAYAVAGGTVSLMTVSKNNFDHDFFPITPFLIYGGIVLRIRYK
ncbi:MAG: hypothetical protein NTU44_05595 [Bacteroidetes bacterium]|nr:hypothetical protein [Bacteroidota bacterium]